MPRLLFSLVVLLFAANYAVAQPDSTILLKPDRVFDGVTASLHDGWVVMVKGERIVTAGPLDTMQVPKGQGVWPAFWRPHRVSRAGRTGHS